MLYTIEKGEYQEMKIGLGHSIGLFIFNQWLRYDAWSQVNIFICGD